MRTRNINVQKDAFTAILSLGEPYEENLNELMTEIASQDKLDNRSYNTMQLGDESYYTVMLTHKYRVLFRVKKDSVDVVDIINHEAMKNYYAKVG